MDLGLNIVPVRVGFGKFCATEGRGFALQGYILFGRAAPPGLNGTREAGTGIGARKKRKGEKGREKGRGEEELLTNFHSSLQPIFPLPHL